jgi:hypothetical protein
VQIVQYMRRFAVKLLNLRIIDRRFFPFRVYLATPSGTDEQPIPLSVRDNDKIDAMVYSLCTLATLKVQSPSHFTHM